MPLTDMEHELRTRARVLLESGKLPSTLPVSARGGGGAPGSCDLCSKRIRPGEADYEVRYSETRKYRFHFICHALWQLELIRREQWDEGDSPALFT
jgi:hypothetical protein